MRKPIYKTYHQEREMLPFTYGSLIPANHIVQTVNELIEGMYTGKTDETYSYDHPIYVPVYRLYLNRYFYFLKELIIVRIMENESKRPVLYLPCKVRTSSDLYAVQAASRQFFVDENRALSAQRKRCFP